MSIDTSLSNRPLSSLDKSVITSSTALFALLVSPFSSVLADSFGRKRVILLADVLFVLGAVIQAGCSTISTMVTGRAIIGAAVGAASFVVPLYIAELAPAGSRGRLVTMNVLFITLGQVVAYVVGWVFSEYGSRATGWRWMVGLGSLPAAFQMALLAFMPETPRWLVGAGRQAEAGNVVKRIWGGGRGAAGVAETTLKNIEIEIREEAETRRRVRHGRVYGGFEWIGLLQELVTTKRNRRALTIACLLQGLQQLCGFVSAFPNLLPLPGDTGTLSYMLHMLLSPLTRDRTR